MSPSAMPRQRADQPKPCAGSFQALVDQQPLTVSSLLASLTLRLELAEARNHWIWKIIAEGKVGQKRTSIGLFFDLDLLPGTYDVISDPRINVVFNQISRWRNVVYHSASFQWAQFTLLEADIPARRLKGQFEFSICAIDFAVTEGAFDVQCLPQ